MPRRQLRVLVAILLAAGFAGVLPAPARASGLHVIPFPGTPDASPSSQIIFSSLVPSDLVSVAVTGSRSGLHRGRVIVLPDRAGTAFAPDRPFSPGDTVEVTAALRSPAAGTRSGDPGATVLRYWFRVAVPGALGARAGTKTAAASITSTPTQSFRSAPHLHPPRVTVTSNPDTRSGDILLTPYNTSQPGPMILNSQGQLVWFHRLVHGPATNLEVQLYQGHPVLTWWQGVFSGSGVARSGQDVIVGRSYRRIATVRAGNGYVADPHEFRITRQGTALIDAWVPVEANLTSVGGPRHGVVIDCVVQELDIKTGQVLWEWHALRHVPFSDSYSPAPSGQSPVYDPYHLNSIQQLRDGNLLISFRNTWAVYEISRSTGRILWELGGRHPSFRMGPGTNFEWQHDARMHADGTVTLFDDAALPQEEPQSSAKQLSLNLSTMTASLVHRYDHSPPLLSGTQGNAQVLPNGDVFVGWGSQPYFSQYSPGGRQIFSGQFPLGVESYRAYRFPWHGQPLTKPSMAVARNGGGTATVYASWNGATQVAAWRVLGGSGRRHLRPVGPASRRRGFETVIAVARQPAYVAVQALASSGRVLGTSTVQADRSR